MSPRILLRIITNPGELNTNQVEQKPNQVA
jgi:hypothetical protein